MKIPKRIAGEHGGAEGVVTIGFLSDGRMGGGGNVAR
jgi:hypothetical protein